MSHEESIGSSGSVGGVCWQRCHICVASNQNEFTSHWNTRANFLGLWKDLFSGARPENFLGTDNEWMGCTFFDSATPARQLLWSYSLTRAGIDSTQIKRNSMSPRAVKAVVQTLRHNRNASSLLLKKPRPPKFPTHDSATSVYPGTSIARALSLLSAQLLANIVAVCTSSIQRRSQR
jgi:hypothetical protein